MSDIPFTRIAAGAEREAAIRAAVRWARTLPSGGAESRLAVAADAPAFRAFLDHPDVAGWIYSLPRPLTEAAVAAFIAEMDEARWKGEGLLFLRFDEAGAIAGYTDVQVWPQWAAGEIAGAMRPDLQNRGQGGAGMAATFTWMFETLGLELICNTTAPDNVRIQRLFQKTGFEHRGDIVSTRPDGTTRASQVWEVTREAWMARMAGGPGQAPLKDVF